MAGILDYVTSSATKTGVRVVIAALEKVGKTTLTVNAPRPLLIPLEQGYAGIVVNKTPMLTSFPEILMLMDEVIVKVQAGQFPYMTLIFDSCTALEERIHEEVLKRDPQYSPGNKKTVTMDSALGGYGKAYNFSNELFRDFLKKCDQLVNLNINIVMTCHVFAAKLMDPMNGEYDSWDLLLHSPKNQKTYGKREMLAQWADVIGFLYEPMYVSEGKTLTKGISANKGRVLALSRTPSYMAGNRFGVNAEIPIPKDGGWNHLAKAIFDSTNGTIDLYNRD